MAYDLNEFAVASGLVFIENRIIAANTNLVTFSGLNGDADGIYQLFYNILNNGAGNANYQFLPNGSSPNASTFIEGRASTASSAGSGSAGEFAETLNTRTAQGVLTFYAKTGTTRRFVANTGQVPTGGSEQSIQYVCEWTDTATNVTSIQLSTAVANAIGINSQFLLFKVLQAPTSVIMVMDAQFNVTTIKTTAYSAAVNELVRVDPSGGAFTVTLPAPTSANKGTVIGIKNVTTNANVITVVGTTSTIDGAASRTYSGAFFEVEFVSDGTSDWNVR